MEQEILKNHCTVACLRHKDKQNSFPQGAQVLIAKIRLVHIQR